MEAVSHDGHLTANLRLLLFISTGLTLIIIGILERILEHKEDEPMHPFWSPALKIITGIVCIVCAFVLTHLHTHIMLLIILLFLGIQMFYGAYAWFTQDIEEGDNNFDQDDLEFR